MDFLTAKEFNETTMPLNKFKTEAVERLLERHQSELTLPQDQAIRRFIDRGAEGIGADALVQVCRLLKCLPTDIMKAV